MELRCLFSSRTAALGAVCLLAAGTAVIAQQNRNNSPVGYTDTPVLPGQTWKVHDLSRPHPRVVTPGMFPTADKSSVPPSDAIVLFDGKDLSQWQTEGKGEDKGKTMPSRWKVENGYVEVVGRTGDLISKEKFGDAQYHIEWAAPTQIDGNSQWRGNSGILLMGRYEMQVLDSFNNLTYADGQAASIYGQWPPLANASRKPGEWQTYDIFFEAPKFEGGRLAKSAYVTIMHNGVMVHHYKEITGAMAHRVVGTYSPHEAEEPLRLQDHDTKVRYRQIWVRRIPPYDQPEAGR